MTTLTLKQANDIQPHCFAVTQARDMGDHSTDLWLWWNDNDGSTRVTRIVLHNGMWTIVHDEEDVVVTKVMPSPYYVLRRNALRKRIKELDEQMNAAILNNDRILEGVLYRRISGLEVDAYKESLADPAANGKITWRTSDDLLQRAFDEGLVSKVTTKR